MDKILSIQNRRMSVLLAYKLLALLSVLYGLVRQRGELPAGHMLPIVLCLFAVGTELVKFSRLLSPTRWFGATTAAVLIFAGSLGCLAPSSDSMLYTLLLLIELMILYPGWPVALLLLHAAAYVLPWLLWPDRATWGSLAGNYAVSLIIGYLFHNIIGEKRKTEQLYEELEDVNRRLKAYASAAEELAVSRERNRIAQELHDSIGHTLVALNMNLEYAEQIAFRDPARSAEVIAKARTLTGAGLVHLRKAVERLRPAPEEAPSGTLARQLSLLFADYGNGGRGGIAFELTMNEAAEAEDAEVKECVFGAVREAVANGVRHGAATRFAVGIELEAGEWVVRISNNGRVEEPGLAPDGDGLRGMRERAEALGGRIGVRGTEKDFEVEMRLPAKGGER
ncbi:MAG: yxjM1 [Paenibacillaceae bacterium]|jgi:signal transduction histidine kinase|nr:yxjM1 [Paenibacillaceae bacterium]